MPINYIQYPITISTYVMFFFDNLFLNKIRKMAVRRGEARYDSRRRIAPLLLHTLYQIKDVDIETINEKRC
jgi:hypothetical protein